MVEPLFHSLTKCLPLQEPKTNIEKAFSRASSVHTNVTLASQVGHVILFYMML